MKTYIQTCFLMMLTSFAHSEQLMTDLMQEADYPKHKKQAATIHQYMMDIRFTTDADNITNVRKPFAQLDTLTMVELWHDKIKRFCQGTIQRFNNFHDALDVNQAGVIESIDQFEQDFRLSDITRTCELMDRELNHMLNDPQQLSRSVNRALTAYRESIERAKGSSVYLKKALLDTSSSVFDTLVALQTQLNTWISIHEFSIHNSDSTLWRQQFEALQAEHSRLYQQHASAVRPSFTVPSNLLNTADAKTLRSRVLELIDDPLVSDVLFQDQTIHQQNRLISTTLGNSYDAISFYAHKPSSETPLMLGWYEKNAANHNDQIKWVEHVVLPNIPPPPTQPNPLNTSPAEPKAAVVSDPSEVVTQPTSSSNSAVDSGASSFHLFGWVLGAIMAVLMVLLGSFLVHQQPKAWVPEPVIKVIDPIIPTITKQQKYLGLGLLLLAALSGLFSLYHLSILSLISACFAAVCGWLNFARHVNLPVVKPLQKLAHELGLAAIILGLMQLVLLLI